MPNLADFIGSQIVPRTDLIMIFCLIACGFYYSFKLSFVQFRMLPFVFKILTERQDKSQKNKDHISPFAALMISTASRVGIGNIAGIATAITLGGAGALFWMWAMAFFGGASAFAESTLAQVYKSKDGKGFKGGPAYYIQKALGIKWLAIAFAIILVLTYAFGFNALQSYTMTSAFEVYYKNIAETGVSFADSNFPPIIGAILALFGAWLFFSHHSLIGKVSSIIVPIMALIYIALAFVAIVMHYELIPSVLKLIFESAFDFEAIFGGFAGSALVIGIKRGLFSNEAGMGSAPNAAAAAVTSHPAKQGIVQSFAVLIDVIICTATGFLVLFSTAYFQNFDASGQPILKALPLVQEAMKSYYGDIGLHFVSFSVVLFAITSLIGNYYYAQANIKFLTNSKSVMMIFRICAVAIIFIGAQLTLELAWNFADLTMAFMATTNIISILLLGGIVKKVMQDFSAQKAMGIDPKFSATKLGIKNAECWE
ncbi:amino acid carrier protein [Campylobacter sp. MIT 12-8780]|uniref:alanine/glycine:cation symporter family protein n=1 Tax=unclassified Campylobacter TaxID=2593542 RepID=UPI00115E1E53|nr:MULTISPECIES: alanine/glycine:cation symporter family protein [unclassified Campylobacter]NDJ26913.1 alanine:cation symporter family protein [Campylobacter sp. MIT 19-121]TQR41942.1 amino acid carrier protein [Campylobacter sp. MIT 12-8780]